MGAQFTGDDLLRKFGFLLFLQPSNDVGGIGLTLELGNRLGITNFVFRLCRVLIPFSTAALSDRLDRRAYQLLYIRLLPVPRIDGGRIFRFREQRFDFLQRPALRYQCSLLKILKLGA